MLCSRFESGATEWEGKDGSSGIWRPQTTYLLFHPLFFLFKTIFRPLVLRLNFSPTVDPWSERMARNQLGQVLGEERSAKPAAVKRWSRLVNFLLKDLSIIGCCTSAESTNLRGSITGQMTSCAFFIGLSCFSYAELATNLLVWPNPNQSNCEVILPPMVSVLWPQLFLSFEGSVHRETDDFLG